ncbi:hypothetical protein GE115_12140 [Agromyces sp. CFH 90414]|uniref:Histidine kinase n=1 Tax=Agromyces agglutinans TaxID=2662258 RepID=A0A6I2F8F7_9MICO|nr:hypothetical protein [Agromyces agglutinans]MRG60611.1 hypothetical protein [Agromyces agglutinans]
MNRRDDHDPGAPGTNGSGPVPPTEQADPRVALMVLSTVLFLEAAMMVAIVGWLVVDLLALAPSSYATAIALIVIAVIAAVWTVAVAVASLRRAHWSRSAAIVWQILQISIAVGAFQGLFARPDVGWALLIPALAVIGILLWPPVRAAFSPDRPAA